MLHVYRDFDKMGLKRFYILRNLKMANESFYFWQIVSKRKNGNPGEKWKQQGAPKNLVTSFGFTTI